MKRVKLFALISLLFIGLGHAWGETYTLDYSQESSLSSSTEWGSYGTTFNYTATDGSTWGVKAYKNAGMQLNTGKNSSIKIPDCPGKITSIEVTCSAAKAVGLSATDYSGSGTISYIATGTDATEQTLDLSSANVTGGYLVPKSGSTSITKIVVTYATGGVTYTDDFFQQAGMPAHPDKSQLNLH